LEKNSKSENMEFAIGKVYQINIKAETLGERGLPKHLSHSWEPVAQILQK